MSLRTNSLAVLSSIALMSSAASAEPLRAVLLDESTPKAHCGVLEVWTVLRFRAAGAKGDTLVGVPCTELPRPSYGATAGDAGVLVKGKTYLLTLSEKQAKGPWGERPAHRAEKIDEAR